MELTDTLWRLPILLALLLIPAIGISQTAGSPEQKHTLRGQVVNSITGQPITGALIQIGGDAMLTDREGQFELQASSLNGGSASKPGYFPEQNGIADTIGMPFCSGKSPHPCETGS